VTDIDDVILNSVKNFALKRTPNRESKRLLQIYTSFTIALKNIFLLTHLLCTNIK